MFQEPGGCYVTKCNSLFPPPFKSVTHEGMGRGENYGAVRFCVRRMSANYHKVCEM